MHIAAVLACPSGVAHTYLAAAALRKYASQYHIEMDIETQGALGIDDELDESTIDHSDLIIISKDINIQGMNRFVGKKVVFLGINEIVNKPEKIIQKIIEYISKK